MKAWLTHIGLLDKLLAVAVERHGHTKEHGRSQSLGCHKYALGHAYLCPSCQGHHLQDCTAASMEPCSQAN